ncbi:MAG TPA: S-4TM family putative pore-forming effector [Pseudonocardiaceae bacterium]|nr:S-4TM family putative pore-forming effector [Pseudonocardiaceae bacterium]
MVHDRGTSGVACDTTARFELVCWEANHGDFPNVDDLVASIMGAPTDPSIQVAQNTSRSKQLVAAQARLYSDAKDIHNARLLLVLFFAFLTSLCAIVFPDARSYIGAVAGFALLGMSLVVTSVEKRRRFLAVSIQEEFDTGIYQLPWNGMLADRPSSVAIAQAAKRYDRGRDANWYSDTGTTQRPFDVLICQMTNLGWGASLHRLWAALLGLALFGIAAAVTLVTWLLHLSFLDCVLALIVPWLAPAKELVDLIRANVDSANSKESLERQIVNVWKEGLGGKNILIETCRLIQDRILHIRQSNAYVPDWLDSVRRGKSQATMDSIVAAMVEEAKFSGHA